MAKEKKTILQKNIMSGMAKTISCMLVIFMTVACNRGDKQEFEIYGKVTGADMEGSLIYLAGLEGNTLVYADSTVISDSTFVFTGIQDKPQIKFLIPLRGVHPTYVPRPFILENGRIGATISDSGMYVSGTPLNDELNKYRQKKIEFDSKKAALHATYRDSLQKMTKEKENSFLEQYKSIEKAESEYIVDVVDKNNDNVLGGYILLENRYILSNEQKKTVLSDAKDEFFLLDGIASIDESLKRRNNISAGQKIPDVKLLDNNDGEMHNLSEYIGKGNFSIINVWASWSVPSVVEIYDLKSVAKKYGSRGVELLSISIDTISDEWVKAIKKNRMYWTNLADLKGWDSNVTLRYQINSIPSYTLINPDGTIIVFDGTLEEVDIKLNQLLKN